MSRTGIIAKKLGMSSMFQENGRRITLTLLQMEDCQVVGTRLQDKDGYNAVVVGAKNAKPSKVSKAQRGAFAKVKIEPKAKVKEFRVTEDNLLEIGTELKASYFSAGQFIDVQGTSIGKGFAGSMKRHNFRGMEASHGVSISHRAHGSTGQCQDPGKVFKNKKMAGHLGHETVTIQNLRIVKVDDESGLLFVSGNVPGPKNGFVFVKDAVKKPMIVNEG